MSEPSTCPQCGAPLVANAAGTPACPTCPPPLSPIPSLTTASPPRKRGAGYIFVALGLILLPALVALAIRGEGAIVASTFLVAPACGLAAGILLGVKIGRTGGSKVLLALGLSVVCVICTEALMMAGCASGILNLKMDFR